MATSNTGTSGNKGSQGQSAMQATSGTQGQTGMRAQRGMQSGDAETGIDNVTYDLVSVIYHALQGAQTYHQYEQDAQRGNDQISQFLREVCENNKRCAQQGLELLQQTLGGQGSMQGGQRQSGHSAQGGQSGRSDSSDPTGEAGQHGRGTR